MFQSNSLSREYLYVKQSEPVTDIKPVGFNPTPYQGSIYTQNDMVSTSYPKVSIQLPIKGVFIQLI